MVFDSIEELIGNTPLLRINPEVHGLKRFDIYAKLEIYNPFGSVKDRVAQGLFAPHSAEIKEQGKTVIESSSGNTAKALAVLAGMHGIPFKAITNRIRYQEIRQTLQLLGAEIEELPGLSDCADPFDPNDAIQFSRALVAQQPDRYHLTDQYYNELNAEAHEKTTAAELLADLGKVDYLFGFLGTCGSTLGTGRGLRKAYPETRVIGIVGEPGHNIPGGRNFEELFEVGLFNREFYNEILSGTTQEAVDGMLELNRRSGVLCGPSTGLVYLKTIEALRRIEADLPAEGERLKAVFFVCDRAEPYLGFLQKQRPEIFAQETVSRATISRLEADEIAEAPQIPAGSLVEFLSAERPLVIDIRGHFAYSLGHIPGALNIVDELLTPMVESGAVFPKQNPVLVVCRIGDQSRKYAAFLSRQGYKSYSLEGGMQALKRQKVELVRGEMAVQ